MRPNLSEDLFFFCSQKMGPNLSEDLFFALHLILGKKWDQTRVKTFFFALHLILDLLLICLFEVHLILGARHRSSYPLENFFSEALPMARYATGVSHCNKLLSMNSLLLIIINNLYILYAILQSANIGILTRKCLFALQRTSKNCLKRTREQRAEERALIYSLSFFKLS